MIRLIRIAAPAVALILASTSRAQMAAHSTAGNGLHFGVVGGVTIPSGDFGDGVNAGYHVGGLIDFSLPMVPFGLRADVLYHRNNVKSSLLQGTDAKAHSSLLGGTLNGLFILPLSSATGIRPYLTAGVGLYNVKVTAEGSGTGGGSLSDDATKFALNGGGGIRFTLGSLSTFVEVRYVSVLSENAKLFGEQIDSKTNFIPISFGVMIGGK